MSSVYLYKNNWFFREIAVQQAYYLKWSLQPLNSFVYKKLICFSDIIEQLKVHSMKLKKKFIILLFSFLEKSFYDKNINHIICQGNWMSSRFKSCPEKSAAFFVWILMCVFMY